MTLTSDVHRLLPAFLAAAQSQSFSAAARLLGVTPAAVSKSVRQLDDAPRDKCAHFREINGIAAAFQHLQKNYNPIASSFL